MIKFLKKLIKKLLPKNETGDQMRYRIHLQNREYNATGIASIKFINGEWYE